MIAKADGQIKAPEWNTIYRELLGKLASGVAPFFGAAIVEPAALAQVVAGFVELTQRNPYYLARSFGDAAKAACARHHFGWMIETLPPQALHRFLTRKTVVWSAEAGGILYEAVLRPEKFVAREGALTLEMMTGKLGLFGLSFTVVPGALFGLEARDALLVSRLQGTADRFDDLKIATKAMSDVAPRALMFAALTGIARAAGIRHIAGVTGENFLTYLPDKHDALLRQYDDFFRSLDASGPQDGFFVYDTLAPPKPVTEVKAGHRIRTRKKRALKEEVAGKAAQAWGGLFGAR